MNNDNHMFTFLDVFEKSFQFVSLNICLLQLGTKRFDSQVRKVSIQINYW